MYLIRRREWRIAFYASVGEPFQILAAMALKIAFRREHRGRTNQHNTAAQQASRACVLRLCIIQVTKTTTSSVPQDDGTTLTTVIADYMGEGGVLEDQTVESSDGAIALDSQFSFNLDTLQGTVTTENFNTQMETITVLQYPVTNPPGLTSMTLQQQLNALAPTVISSSVKNGLN
jgi:hypothetical protein